MSAVQFTHDSSPGRIARVNLLSSGAPSILRTPLAISHSSSGLAPSGIGSAANSGYSLTGLATFQQEFHLGWYVVDANHTAVVIPEDPATELHATADTLEELGARMMVRDPATFTAEVAKCNGFIDAGKDADFGKALDGCQKIETAPFYAVPIRPVPYQAYGGIAVDVDGHVLDTGDEVIPGLYAAGICTGSFAAQAGLFYLSGVSQALAFGRQAGKNAAAEESWA